MADSLSSDVGGIRLGDYVARLRRRWYIVVVGLVLGLAASVLYSKHAGPEYTSTSLVLVQSTDALSASAAAGKAAINLDTEAQIVKSAGLADAAAKLMKTSAPPLSLLKNVTVTVPPNSQILAIAYTAPTARGAQQGSHAFAQSYLTNRSVSVATQVKAQVTTLTAQVADLTTQLKRVTAQIASLPSNSTDRAYADAQKTILSSQIMALNGQLAPLRDSAVTPGQIITDAPLPNRPTSPGPGIVIVGGLLIGLLIGVGLAAVLTWLDPRVRRSGDVASRLSLPILGDLVAFSHRHRGGVVPLGDDADRLRNSVVAIAPSARVIQVVATKEGGGAGSSALPLAASFAEVQRETILVLLDPRSALPGVLGISTEIGLSDVLSGRAELADVVQPVVSLPWLQVVPIGTTPAALGRMLASDDGSQIFSELREMASVVICESADPTRSALSQSLLPLSDLVLLAAERGATDVHHLEAAAVEIARLGGFIGGVVLAPPVKHAWRPSMLSPRTASTIAHIDRLTDRTQSGGAGYSAPEPDDDDSYDAEMADELTDELTDDEWVDDEPAETDDESEVAEAEDGSPGSATANGSKGKALPGQLTLHVAAAADAEDEDDEGDEDDDLAEDDDTAEGEFVVVAEDGSLSGVDSATDDDVYALDDVDEPLGSDLEESEEWEDSDDAQGRDALAVTRR